MIRLPPTSPLFPYTTLFRSGTARRPADGEGLVAAEGRLEEGAADRRVHVGGDAEGDRKSTRLNSSHTVISYAVFCLKKKKREKKRARVGRQTGTAAG